MNGKDSPYIDERPVGVTAANAVSERSGRARINNFIANRLQTIALNTRGYLRSKDSVAAYRR